MKFAVFNNGSKSEIKMTEKFFKTVVLFRGTFLLCLLALYTVAATPFEPMQEY